MIPTKSKKIEFERLSLGVKFRYNEDDVDVWVKIDHLLVAKWDENKKVDWMGQPIECFPKNLQGPHPKGTEIPDVVGEIGEDVFVVDDLLDEPKRISLGLNAIFASLF
jgi:hypothetical protein